MQYHQVYVPSENIYVGFDPLELPNFLHFDRDQWSHDDGDEEPKDKVGPSLFQKGSWKDADVEEIPYKYQLNQKQSPLSLIQ